MSAYTLSEKFAPLSPTTLKVKQGRLHGVLSRVSAAPTVIQLLSPGYGRPGENCCFKGACGGAAYSLSRGGWLEWDRLL